MTTHDTGAATYPQTGTATGAPAGATAATGSDDRSLGQIVSDLSTDLSTLVKQEMELARTELKQEAAKAGKGAGLLGGAGVAGLIFLLMLSLTVTWALDQQLDLWLSALIVTAVWAVAAAVLALLGRKELQAANPQLPQTQQTLKEDAAWARAQKS